MRSIFSALTFVIALTASAAAFAQSTTPSGYSGQDYQNPQYQGELTKYEVKSDWNISVGAGTIYSPKFVGSKDNSFKLVPDIRIDYDDVAFLNFQDGLGYNFRPTEALRLGPVAKIDWGRPEDGGSFFAIDQNTDELRGLGDVDPTFELGGFAEYKFLQNYAAKFELRHGIGGHDGLVEDFYINYMNRVGDITLTLGPRMRFADDNYINSYFGITPSQSAASGLATYQADGGIFSYGIGGAAIMPLTESFTLTGFIGYDRLASEVADSPLVERRGDPDQAIVGATVSYGLGK